MARIAHSINSFSASSHHFLKFLCVINGTIRHFESSLDGHICNLVCFLFVQCPVLLSKYMVGTILSLCPFTKEAQTYMRLSYPILSIMNLTMIQASNECYICSVYMELTAQVSFSFKNQIIRTACTSSLDQLSYLTGLNEHLPPHVLEENSRAGIMQQTDLLIII